MPDDYWGEKYAGNCRYKQEELADGVKCAFDCVVDGAVVAGMAVTHWGCITVVYIVAYYFGGAFQGF